MSSRLSAFGAGLLLSAVVVLVFLPTLDHGWAPVDDALNLTGNEHYRGLACENLRWMWTTRLAGHYIPLSWMTLGADYLLYGMDPAGYHRTQLLLHLANALLFFGLAIRLLRRDEVAVDAPARARASVSFPAVLGAFAAAALFAFHPMRVESVAWITERRDLLCTLFVLITVHLYVGFVRHAGGRRRASGVAIVLAFTAAVLSKGIALVLPAVLLLLDVGPLRRLGSDPRRWRWSGWRPLLVEKLPLFALSAAAAVATLWAAAPVIAAAGSASLEHRLLAAGFSFFFYLEKTFVPFSIPFQVPTTGILTLPTSPGIALRGAVFALIGSFALLAAWRWRRPQAALALAAYALFVLPVSGLFQAGPQLVANRYSYLSCLPLVLLAGGAIESGLRLRWPSWPRRIAAAAAVLALSALLARSARAEVALWRDDVTFWQAAVRGAPRAWAPAGGLAAALLVRGEPAEAHSVLRAARERIPGALYLTWVEALLLATSPSDEVRDGEQALELAMECVRATSFQDPAALLALAAAAAECGDAAGARRLLDSAEALSLSGRKPQLLPALRAAGLQIARSGRVRLAPADWERLLK